MLEATVQFSLLWLLASPGLDHAKHLTIDGFPVCARCHMQAERADTVWPATESHAACNEARCHAKDFSPAGYGETKICTTCHVKKSRIGAPVQSFPPKKAEADFYAEISHATHLAAKVQKKLKDRCLDCHRIDRKTREVARPGHTACLGCHDAKADLKMTDCAKCHVFRRDQKGALMPMGPRGLDNPCRVTEKFSHKVHRLDARQANPPEISCGTCHFGLEKAKTLADIVPTHGRQTMVNACGKCHRPGEKTAAGQPLVATSGDCTRCHADACLTVGPAPSWHR